MSRPPALDLNFLGGTLDPRLTFTRASSATRYNSAGVLVSESANTPRFDYDPVTLAARGLLLEPQRTNILLSSSTVGVGTGWADGAGGNDAGNLVVTGNAAIAPDGTMTATLIADNSTVTVLGRQQPVTVAASNNYYSVSAHIKAGTSSVAAIRVTIGGGTTVIGDAVVNLATGAAQWRSGSAGFALDVEPCGNGWYRLFVTVKDVLANGNTFITAEFRPAFAPTYSDTLQLSHTGSAYFWSAGIASSSTGKVLGSHIQTTPTAQATRFADVLTLPQTHGTALLTTPEFTIYAEYSLRALNGSNQFVYDITDGTISREVGLYINNSGTSSIVNTSGTNAVPYLAGTPAVGAVHKHALSVKNGQLLTALNGINAGGGSPSPMPTLDRIRFGNRVDESFPAQIWLRKLTVQRRALTQAQINAMTS